MMMGATGDYLLETAASLTIIMIVTGIYLWWVNSVVWKAVLSLKQEKAVLGGVTCTVRLALGFL